MEKLWKQRPQQAAEQGILNATVGCELIGLGNSLIQISGFFFAQCLPTLLQAPSPNLSTGKTHKQLSVFQAKLRLGNPYQMGHV